MKLLKGLFVGIFIVSLVGLIALLNLLKVSQLNEYVTLIQPRIASLGANIVVYQNNDRRIVVDSQLSPLAILASYRIDALGTQDHLVITHWHPDHSGGYARIRGEATVLAHDNNISRLSTDQTGYDLTAPGSVHKFKARPLEKLPNQAVTSKIAIDDVEVVHFSNAHTDGDLVVFFPAANVVAVGDLVWPNAFPFLDVHTGGSATGLLNALDTIITRISPTTLVIPGHGAPLTATALQTYRDRVAGSIRAVICADNNSDAENVLATWQAWHSELVPAQSWYNMVMADETAKTMQECG